MQLGLGTNLFSLILLIWVLIITLIYWTYLHRQSFLTKSKAWLLWALRFSVFTLLLFLVGEPVFSWINKKILKPQIAFLIDNSTSMSELISAESLQEKLKKAFQNNDFQKLQKQAEITWFEFSDSLKESNLSDLNFSGEITSIGQALRHNQEIYKGKNLNAIFLLSDGNDNFGPDPLQVAKNLDVKIYSLGLGDTVSEFDNSIVKVEYDTVTYVGEPTSIKVTLQSNFPERVRSGFFLKERNKIVNQKMISLSGSGWQQEEVFTFVPAQEGLSELTVSLPPMKNEISSDNNHKTFYLRVFKNKIKALLLTDNLNWEFTFLKRFLTVEKNIELETVIIGKKEKLSESKLSQKALNEFDFLIFVDCSSVLLSSIKAGLESFLTGGKGILFLLDDKLAKDRLGPLPFLPVELSDLETSFENFNLVPTPAGQLFPVTRLEETWSENLEAWKNQVPFAGILKAQVNSASAQVLATHQNFPGIIIDKYKSGKVAVTLIFAFWRWDFVSRGWGRTLNYYPRFFGSLVRWLSSPDQREKIKISPSKRIFKSGEKINFEGIVLDELFQVIPGARVEIKISSLDSNKSQTTSFFLSETQNGQYSGSYGPLKAGRYHYNTEVSLENVKLGESRGEFAVEEFSLEDQVRGQNFVLLNILARQTGGKYFPLDSLENAFRELQLSSLVEEKERRFLPQQQIWVLMVIVLSLSVEWFIRKKNQLL